MIEFDIVIPNALGLHARAAAKLVHAASAFKCSVHVEKDNKSVNGKSILGILLLAAGLGSKLHLVFEGSDEKSASEAIRTLIEDGFGEMTEETKSEE